MTTGLPSLGPNSARHISMSLTWTGPATVAGGSSGIGGSTFHGCSAEAPATRTTRTNPKRRAAKEHEAYRDILPPSVGGRSRQPGAGAVNRAAAGVGLTRLSFRKRTFLGDDGVVTQSRPSPVTRQGCGER